MSDEISTYFHYLGGSRGSDSKRNGVKGPPERRMENGVSY